MDGNTQVASTVTFGEQLDWLAHKNASPRAEGVPEGATQISMWTVFPDLRCPMSWAWNNDGVIPFKVVLDHAQYLVDEHEVGDEVRLTIELLLQAVRKVGREHPEIIDIENAEVHA